MAEKSHRLMQASYETVDPRDENISKPLTGFPGSTYKNNTFRI